MEYDLYPLVHVCLAVKPVAHAFSFRDKSTVRRLGKQDADDLPGSTQVRALWSSDGAMDINRWRIWRELVCVPFARSVPPRPL